MSSALPAKLRIVFDTNIFISAFIKSGFSRELFELAVGQKIEVFCSPQIISELESKLRSKFSQGKDDINPFLSTVSRICDFVDPKAKLNIVKKDSRDNIVLECAVEARANLIISLDKHLLRIKKYKNIGIIHPKTLRWIVPEFFGKGF